MSGRPLNEVPVRALAQLCVYLCMLLVAQPATGNEGQAASEAGTLYAEYCSVCHGEKGDGDSMARRGLQPPPRDFTSAQSARLLTLDYVDHAIRNGKPGTAMVGWQTQLDDGQIHALAEYILSEFVRAPVAASPDGGARIYAETCSVCHGEDGHGAVWGRQSLDPPPVNFAAADRQRLTRERMIKSVTQGRQGTAMTAFGSRLNDAEIAAVVDYVRTVFMPEPMSAAPSKPRAATTVGMAVLHGEDQAGTQAGHDHSKHDHGAETVAHAHGDAARGKPMYADNCAACHGTEGDGQGPRAYFIFPKPRNFLDPAVQSNFDRASLIASITHGVKGREMPAWRNVLTEQQIADVAEYVYVDFIHTGHDHADGHSGH